MTTDAERPPDAEARALAQRKRRFVWRHGVVGWGLSTALLWTAAMCLLRALDDGLTWRRAFYQLAAALVLFPIGGYFWGLWTWGAVQRARESVRRSSDDARR